MRGVWILQCGSCRGVLSVACSRRLDLSCSVSLHLQLSPVQGCFGKAILIIPNDYFEVRLADGREHPASIQLTVTYEDRI